MRRFYILLLAIMIASVMQAKTLPTADKIDAKLLKLNLQVLLYSKDLKNALTLAKAGAKSYPDDPWWLTQVAQISRWTNHPDLAKEYYFQLYAITQDKKTLHTLSSLIKATHDTPRNIKLLKKQINQGDASLAPNLREAFDAQGLLEEGVEFFLKTYQKDPKKIYLKSAILLDISFDRFAHIQKLYQRYVQKYGNEPTLSFEFAKKLFANKSYHDTFMLLDAIVKDIPPTQNEFWELYIDLAYILKKEQHLYATLKRRFKHKQLAAQNLEKLLYLSEKKEPSFTPKIIQSTWKEHPNITNFYRAIYQAQEAHQNDKITQLLESVPKELQTQLEKEARYWLIKAANLQERHQEKKAMQAYQHAATLAPNNPEIQASLLWGLINQHDPKKLKKYLFKLERTMAHAPALQLPMASSYLILQQTKEAKKHFERHYKTHPLSWQEHIVYADLLQVWSDTKGVQSQMYRAWNEAKKEAKKSDTFKNAPEKYYDFLRLASYFQPKNTPTYLHQAGKRLSTKQKAELSLGMLMQQGAFEQIKTLTKQQQLHYPWLSLAIALTDEDQTKMQQLLETKKENLSISDRVVATQKIGMTHLADEMSFEGLERNPRNQQLSTLAHQRLKKDDQKVSFQSSSIRRSDLSYIDSSISYLSFLPWAIRSKLTLSNQHQLTHTIDAKDTTQLALTLDKQQKSLHHYLTLHFNTGSYQELGWKLKTTHNTQAQQFGITLAQHQKDDSTNRQLFLGNKSTIMIESNRQLTQTDTLLSSLHYNRYYRHADHLADSYGASLEYKKQLRIGYPQLGYHTYGQFEAYHDSDHALFSSDRFWQVGTGILIGNIDAKYRYRTPKAFAIMDFAYNNTNTLGYTIKMGLNGMLYHRDNWQIEAFYSSGFGEIKEDVAGATCRYGVW